MRAIASGPGARVVGIRAGVPDGYSAAVALQVADPVWVLRHRVSKLQAGLDRLGSDGIFLALYEADGRPLYVAGGSRRLDSGLGWIPDGRCGSCVQMGTGGPMTLVPPLPCPSGWRPPPSTPPKRPVVHGWVSAGWAAGAPIRYSGARIRIPASPSESGTAAELGPRPYTPERPFTPFTIRPGDWAGVNLHYAIARACTPATAGRTITENRTFTVTYTMQGATQTATCQNTAFTITLPATCPGS